MAESDGKAFLSGFFEDYHLFIRKMARRYADDPDMEEEVCQDTWLHLLEAQDTLSELDRYALPQYIVKTVRSCAYRFLLEKKEERERRVPWNDLTEKERPQESAEETVLRTEDIACVMAAIDELPEKERRVFLTKLDSDLDQSCIASAFGISVASVYTYVSRARERLKKALYREEDGY